MRRVILIRLTNIFLASCCTRLLINTMPSFHLIVLKFARWRRYVCQIHRTEKDGDWYIYPYFLVNESLKKAHKNAKKSSKTFKLSIHSVVSTGTNLCKNIYILFAGREVRPRAVLKTEGTVFLNTDRPRPANNIFIFFLLFFKS